MLTVSHGCRAPSSHRQRSKIDVVTNNRAGFRVDQKIPPHLRNLGAACHAQAGIAVAAQAVVHPLL